VDSENAEIFHGIRHLNTHFLAYPEKMINSILGSEDDSGNNPGC